jgi:WD40 repeat protein
VADSLGVTEVGGADVLVYVSPATFSLQRLDLATGAATALSIDMASLPGSASVGGGRLATFGDDGLALWDLATGDPVAVGPVDLPVRAADATSGLFTGNLVLSPDGTTLAALVGDGSGTSDVVVVDLASGGEIFRRTVSTSMEGANLSYDGTTVAVGNFYDSYGPVQIFDLATGAQRTVDAHGILP